MSFVTLAEARAQCKADTADDTMLTIYLAAAEKACLIQANRNVYVDGTALTAAIAASATASTSANVTYAAALLAAESLTDLREKSAALTRAYDVWQKVYIDQLYTNAGIVIDELIRAAILLTVGHLYRNRENVMTGVGATAVEMPQNATWIMNMYRKEHPIL